MLQDIMDQWDIEDNFEYCFNQYCNYLEREGKWKFCEKKTMYNFKYRMKQVHKGEDPTKEWKKFELWVQKRRVIEQKEVERRAVKINYQYKARCELLETQNAELQKEISQLKKQYEELEEKYFRLMDSDSSDDEPIQKIEY